MEEEEIKEIHDNLTFNYLIDQKKKKVNNLARAKLIRNYLKKNHMSAGKLAFELEIPKSTVQDWLLWEKLTEADYRTLKHRLESDTSIYRLLRNNRKKSAVSLIEKTAELTNIHQIKKLVKQLLNNPPKDKNLIVELEDIKNTINRVIMRMERY